MTHRRGWHPEQPRWCALLSFLFGPKQFGGSSWHTDGTDHWWQCVRCGANGSSL